MPDIEKGLFSMMKKKRTKSLAALVLIVAMLTALLPGGVLPLSLASDFEPPAGSIIQDPSFYAHVLGRIGQDAGYVIASDDVKDITFLNMPNLEIYSLEGIEHFTSLVSLTCPGNNLTELDLSALSELTYLYCQNNKLSALDIGSNAKLSYLDCSGNLLDSLDVSGNPALRFILCQANRLRCLDISSNASLVGIACYYNRMGWDPDASIPGWQDYFSSFSSMTDPDSLFQYLPQTGGGSEEFIAPIVPIENLVNFGDYIEISNEEQLSDIRHNPGGKYYLSSDIVLGNDWIPIDVFTGILDGQGYSVFDMTIRDFPARDAIAGLFGTVRRAEIRNLALEDILITATSETRDARVGGIAGVNTGSIINNCYSTGFIHINTRRGIEVGGISGRNINGATIISCWNAADIDLDHLSRTFANNYVGGISGANREGSIIRSFNKGDVRVNDGRLGGIAGYNHNGVVKHCYNAGSLAVSWSGFIGGICGDVRDKAFISFCYSSGTVDIYSGSSGGISGDRNIKTRMIATSYYSSAGVTTDNSSAIPLTPAEMKDKANFPAFNFSTVWDIDPAVNDGYPFFRKDSPAGCIDGSCCIAYGGIDIIIPGSIGGTADARFAVNLTQERVQLPAGYAVTAYSVNGGGTWKSIARRSIPMESDSNPFNSSTSTGKNNFSKLLNKPLELQIAVTDNRGSSIGTVTFPRINGRDSSKLKMTVNYKAGEDKTASTPGQWLPGKERNAAELAYKQQFQVGAAEIVNREKNRAGKTVSYSMGWGNFRHGDTQGICLKPLGSKGRTQKAIYFVRTPPGLGSDGVTYNPGGKPLRVSAKGEGKMAKYKLKAGVVAVKRNTYVMTTGAAVLYTAKSSVSVTGNTTLWQAATTKKPAGAVQTLD